VERSSVKILAFGDAQLGAHGRLDDQADVLDKIASVAIDRNVDLVLNGGDTFEGGEIKPTELRVFADFIARLRDAGIPCLTVIGNGRHDRHRSADGLDIFREIPGVTVASSPDVYRFEGCMVAALPWVSPARLQAAYGASASRDEVTAHVTSLLIDVAQQLHEDCRQVAANLPAVLLTHFAISGASLPTGLPVEMLKEPVLPLQELEAVGFDAVVASHIHKPQLLSNPERDGTPHIFFTGSPMAHDHGESGFTHGVWLLALDTEEMHAEFVPIESRRLLTMEADLVDKGDSAHLPWLWPDDLEQIDGSIVRVKYRATADQARHIDIAAMRASLLEAGAHSVSVQPEIVRADRARVAGLDEGVSELDALEDWFRANTVEPGLADRMREKTREYLEAVA
jgi:DNA repair exonuclease SbcCD nuclease subunit